MRLIDADALKRDIDLAPDEWAKGRTIEGVIAEQPTIDAEPVRHGRWIHDINNLYGCSECFTRETMSHKKRKNFCSNCGAKMDLEVQDD